MNKLISIVLMAVLLCSFSVFADDTNIQVNIKSITEDVITVSGEASLDEIVTVYILNPGKTEEDADLNSNMSNSDVYQFFGTTLANAGRYSIDIKIVPYGISAGGEYKIYAICGGKLYESSYTFYSYTKKQEFVGKLKDAADPDLLEDDLPEIAEVFGIDALSLYKNEDLLSYATYICDLNDIYVLENPEQASVLLYDALVLSALNSGNESLFEEGVFAFWEQLSDDTMIYDDYLDINEMGKTAIKKKILANDYNSLSDAFECFKELTMLYGITENSLGGSGHVETYFSDYHDEYEDAGFKLDDFENYKNKKTIYSLLAKSTATSIELLADEFNKAIEPKTSSGGSSGGSLGGTSGGSSGGGGFSGGSTGSAAGGIGETSSTPSDYVTGTDEKSNPTVTYVDVPEGRWYYEPVSILTAYSIISGYPGGRFEPMKTVSRAELLKMLSIAFPLESEGEGITFSDVAEDSWYAPYIKKASSQGIFLGSDGAAYPDLSVTREDAAVLLYRFLAKNGITMTDNKDFDDNADMSDYAKEAISKLAGFGILNGNGSGSYLPKNSITRAEAAQMIYSALVKTGGVKN